MRKEVAQGGGEELAAVVALHALYRHVELRKNVHKEPRDGGGGVGLVAQREGPRVV